MDIISPLEIIVLALLVAVGVLGGFVWKLHKAGVANKDLLPQAQLKGADLVDTIEDKMFAALRKWAADHPATMKDSYFDVDDFLMDVGRLPATYTNSITLDGAIKRNGSSTVSAYYKQANGNVTQNKPA